MRRFFGKTNKFKVAPKIERTYMGTVFASKAEMLYFRDVIMPQLNSGKIKDVTCQKKFELGVPENVYVADFTVTKPDGSHHTVDIKGMSTPKFNHDRLLWSRYGPHPLHVIKRVGENFKTLEVITPGTELARKPRKKKARKAANDNASTNTVN